jgi:hypothetical protein
MNNAERKELLVITIIAWIMVPVTSLIYISGILVPSAIVPVNYNLAPWVTLQSLFSIAPFIFLGFAIIGLMLLTKN